MSRRTQQTALLVSKHTASIAKRYGEVETIVQKKEILDPRKLAFLETIEGLNNTNPDLFEGLTGAELRKARKAKAKEEEYASSESDEIVIGKKKGKKGKKVKVKGPQQVRFMLGNGIEVSKASTINKATRIGVPYCFDSGSLKLVIDEDDFFENVDKDGDNHATEMDSQTSENLAEISFEDVVAASAGKDGWRVLLNKYADIPATHTPSEEQKLNYFAICLSSMFASLTSYAPVDVNMAIKTHCWYDGNPDIIDYQYKIVQGASEWDAEAVSKGCVWVKHIDEHRPISVHDGALMAVRIGALGAYCRQQRWDVVDTIWRSITKELRREASAFAYLHSLRSHAATDTTVLKLAEILTKNAQAIDDALSHFDIDIEDDSEGAAEAWRRTVFSLRQLAQMEPRRFNGQFVKAGKVCDRVLVSGNVEAARRLKEVRGLRNTFDLQLPSGPWLESWGRTVSVHPALSEDEKTEVAKQLLSVYDSQTFTHGHVACARALYGMLTVTGMERMQRDLDTHSLSILQRSQDLRAHLGLKDDAFADRLGKQAREILDVQE